MGATQTKEKKTIGSREAQTHFGKLLDTARREPVVIQKHGRNVAVMLSAEEYDELLERLEDVYWTTRSTKSARRGYLGHKESEQLLKKLEHVEG